jgi:hypothetical protein
MVRFLFPWVKLFFLKDTPKRNNKTIHFLSVVNNDFFVTSKYVLKFNKILFQICVVELKRKHIFLFFPRSNSISLLSSPVTEFLYS